MDVDRVPVDTEKESNEMRDVFSTLKDIQMMWMKAVEDAETPEQREACKALAKGAIRGNHDIMQTMIKGQTELSRARGKMELAQARERFGIDDDSVPKRNKGNNSTRGRGRGNDTDSNRRNGCGRGNDRRGGRGGGNITLADFM